MKTFALISTLIFASLPPPIVLECLLEKACAWISWYKKVTMGLWVQFLPNILPCYNERLRCIHLRNNWCLYSCPHRTLKSFLQAIKEEFALCQPVTPPLYIIHFPSAICLAWLQWRRICLFAYHRVLVCLNAGVEQIFACFILCDHVIYIIDLETPRETKRLLNSQWDNKWGLHKDSMLELRPAQAFDS